MTMEGLERFDVFTCNRKLTSCQMLVPASCIECAYYDSGYRRAHCLHWIPGHIIIQFAGNDQLMMVKPIGEALTEALTSLDIRLTLKAKQKECISYLAEEKDVLAILPTGYGKSLIYTLLPRIYDIYYGHPDGHHIIVVVSPLLALMEEQVSKMSLSCIASIIPGVQYTEKLIIIIF